MVVIIFLIILFLAFIESGIIITFFSLIWSFSSFLTIILIFRYHRNLKSKDFKRTIKNNDIDMEIINRSCIMIKGKNEFRITEEYFYHKIECLMVIIIMLVISVQILIVEILLQILKYLEIKHYSALIAIILIFIIPLNVPWIITYLYYRNRKTECFIDKASELILFKKLLSNYKILKKIIFSDFKTFSNSLSDSGASTYSLKFTDINGVKIIMLEGDEKQCIHIYNKISDFLGFKFPD